MIPALRRTRESTPHGRSRRVLALSTVGALALTGVLPSSAALGAAAPSGPVATLAAASKTITLSHFPDEEPYADPGLYAVTGNASLELRTTRPDWKTAPKSRLVLRGKGGSSAVTVPQDLVNPDGGLADFTTGTLKNSRGKVVATTTDSWCPGGGDASRIRPDAAATSAFPMGCSASPWSFGIVTGIPAHWASSLQQGISLTDSRGKVLPDGTYTLVATISERWRKILRTPESKARAQVKIVLKTVQPEPGQGEVSAARATPSSRFPAQVPASMVGRVDGLLPARVSSAAGTGAAPNRFAAPGAESVPSVAGSGPAVSPLAASTGALQRSPAGRVPTSHRPDLRSLPAFGAEIIGDWQDPLSTREYLSFAATVWNAGPAPLVVDGYRSPGADFMDAYQFFYNGKGKQRGWTGTGSMKYDPRTGHEHWHFLDFAKYELVTSTGKAILSQKEAFCLAATDSVDLTVKGARYQPNSTGLSTACGSQQSIAIRETLDPGWGDTYGQYLPGQAFDITDLPNGKYTIKVTANPDGKLLESSTKNNVSTRTVVLGGRKGARSVAALPVDGLDIP